MKTDISFWKEWCRKLNGWLRRDALDAELREEIQTHLDMKAEDVGSPLAARKRFGNSTLVLEDARSAWSWPRPEAWLRDLRYGLRVMKRRPGFALTVIGALSLGIGATVSVFSVVDLVVIRALPYHDPDRLVALGEVRTSAEQTSGVAPGRLEDWNRLATTFEGLAGSYIDTLTEVSGSVPEQIAAAFVSPRFFSVFHASALVGRVFTPEEERFGGPAVAVISYGLWQRRFASDPSVVGRRVVLPDQSYTIVGVMPVSFQYPAASTELWVPKQARPELMRVRAARFYRFSFGRLRPSATVEQARADLGGVQARLAEQYPKTDSGWTVRVEPLKEAQTRRLQLALWLLFGSAAVLLLIACSNVACLLLAQFNARNEEVATRRALGASRTAIARQLLAEGVVYAMAGSLAGILLAFTAVAVLRKSLPELPRIGELAVDLRALTFAAATSVAVAILVSLAPMIQMLGRKDGQVRCGRSVIGRGQLLPRTLVSAQIALATVLLVGSGLFLQSLLRLQETDLGFQTDRVLTFRVSATFNEAPDAVVQRHRRSLEALSSLPGVESVAMSSGLPGTFSGSPLEFRIVGQENTEHAAEGYAAQRVVTAGYFRTLGVPILTGETCRMDSDPKKAFEAVVNQAFAEGFLQGRGAVGATVTQGPQGSARIMRIVGVVANTREAGYARTPEPLIYACGYLRFWPDSEFLIQTRGAPETLVPTIREAIRTIEPARVAYAVLPLTSVLSETLSHNRFRAWLITLFSAVALTLAGVGVYGVTAYMVSQRTREFGIRIALGARPAQIWTEILRSSGWLAAMGTAIGGLLAFMATPLIATLLYGVGKFDALSYLYAAGVLFTAAILACLVPAKRATSIDPALSLREQ